MGLWDGMGRRERRVVIVGRVIGREVLDGSLYVLYVHTKITYIQTHITPVLPEKLNLQPSYYSLPCPSVYLLYSSYV